MAVNVEKYIKASLFIANDNLKASILKLLLTLKVLSLNYGLIFLPQKISKNFEK